MVLMLAPHAPRSAVDVLLRAADRGARVYVLASPGFAEGQQDPGLHQRRDARVLVRRMAGLPVSCILTQRGTRAGVWLGPAPDAAPRWWLSVSPAQGQSLFRAVMHLFWHEAETEAWTGAGPLRFQQAPQRPFDTPAPPPGAPVHLVRSGPLLDGAVGDILYHPAALPLPTGPTRPRVLFCPASQKGQEELAALTRKGLSIVWEDLGLPAFRVDARTGLLETGSDAWRLRLVLEQDQARALYRLASSAADGASWRLRTDLALADIQGDVWLPGTNEPQPRLEERELGAASVQARTLRRMPGCAPESWPPAPVLALNVTYRWKVAPPRLPPGTSEAPLIRDWRKLDEDAARRLEVLKQCIADTETHGNSLTQSFVELAGALLGFGRTRKQLAQQVEAAAKQPPSELGPGGARALLRHLTALEEQVAELAGGMTKVEHDAREARERKEQERAWEQRRDEARKSQEKASQERERVREELEPKELELKTLTSEQGAPDDKERKARQQLLANDIERLKKRLYSLDKELRQHEQTLKEPFKFTPSRSQATPSRNAPRTPGARFVPAPGPQTADTVPQEALPALGRLLQHKSERYLVVSRWEELARGEAESERLSASLVAPAEAT
ncbi:hypothetical protein KYC5002_21705 [Archangium violaceum]|uniref:hypothetical protein n=1 Tax=Archangium violaceum TaxID=83451 RepID=UPI002B2E1C89|nr:hypothetical protein KYC5002_21705 [Archangium gephyra]